MPTMSALATALDIAARGLPVFPCGSNKKPAISKAEGGRGFQDATCDSAAIRRMFDRRNAVLVGVPTGPASGFDVLDFDYRHGAAVWEQANTHRLPETRSHQSQSGGRHLLFHHAPGVRNSASKLTLALGMDVRGDGGYVIMPPSSGYSVISDAPLAHWPDWLLPLVLPAPRAPSPPRPPGAHATLSDARLGRIKESVLGRVRSAPDGAKHFQLRNMALLLGGIAEQAGFTDETAIRWLLDALSESVRDMRAAERTAAWGLENGRTRPIEIAFRRDEVAPDPRRKAAARSACKMLRAGLCPEQAVLLLQERNCMRADPLPRHVIAETVIWAARQPRGRARE